MSHGPKKTQPYWKNGRRIMGSKGQEGNGRGEPGDHRKKGSEIKQNHTLGSF